MALTEDQVKEKIKLKKVDGVWGISLPSDFVSAEVELKITRRDSYSKCKQAIKDSIKFADNSNDELGIRVGLAGDMDPDHDNKIGLQTVFDDQYDDNGVALVDFDIGNVSTNYNEGDAPNRTETDTLNINKNNTFYKFDTLEGRTDGGNVIDYQDYLKNGNTSNWDGRELPDISSDGQKLDFHDNDGSDNNARMTFTSKDVEFNKKPSLTKIEVQKGNGNYGSKDVDDGDTISITRTVQPAKRTFYVITLTGKATETKLTSTDRDGNNFYKDNKAILLQDNCNGDEDDGTDRKNTLVEIKSVNRIVLTGPPPDDDDPEPTTDPDPTTEPETPDITVVTVPDTTTSCNLRENTSWSSPYNWAPSYIPSCSPQPATVSDPGGVMSLDRDPSNKKKVSLTFTDIPAGATGQALRQKLNLPDTASARSMKNKLITIKVTYEKRAGWANSLTMTASCSDIKNPDGVALGGTPYSRPSASESYADGAANVSDREWYFYNIDGSSTVDFVFSSTPGTEPTRCYFTGESVTVTGPVTTTDAEGNVTETYTEVRTCIPASCITEGYSEFYRWPVCPEEVYVTRTGGTTASAVYSDGHHDGANDQFIDIELIAIRETATGLDGDGMGVIDELEKFVWVTSSTADNADNLGSVDGRSLIDYDEHSDKIRFRNPTTRTSATGLATNGTGITELKDHSGALLPGTIDTKVNAASSLPINLSY